MLIPFFSAHTSGQIDLVESDVSKAAMKKHMVSGFGQFHTNEADPSKPNKRLTPYATIDLNGIRGLVDNPQEVGKENAQWFIPSRTQSRNFKTQEKEGEFIMLVADLDQDPKPIADVKRSLQNDILGIDCNFEVYTSRSATVIKPKARVLIPLIKPLSHAEWKLCQEILNDELLAYGFTPDRASERAAQLCYLPNRGEHYEAQHEREGVLLDPEMAWGEKLRIKRQALADQAKALEASRQAAQDRREVINATIAAGGDRSLIDAFNEAYSVGDILIKAGYEQRGNTFRHPASESGSYSATVKDDRVHTFSTTDPLFTDGLGAHDAFSAFEVLYHDGIQSAAMKDAGDNWLKIESESWNKVSQREYMQKKTHTSLSDFADVDPKTGEVVVAINLPFGCEQSLADKFAIESYGKFRWSPGMDWMVNLNTHWEHDVLLTRFNLAKNVCKLVADTLNQPRLAAKICSASTVNAVIALARSSVSIATPVKKWDCHPLLLNTPDEVIDLETGLAVSREGLLFTQVTGVAPKRLPTPIWDQFINEIFNGDLAMIEFIQRMGGYALTGSIKEQKLFFLWGSGANGKSVFLDVMRNLGGLYSYNLPSEALMSLRNEGHPTMFAALQGKRLAISSEIDESAHWAESRIKSMTGDETLTSRRMKQDFFTFNITHKHFIAGNFKPRLKGDDFAIVRRLVLVPFTQRFEGDRRDKNLSEKLKKEYAGILYWFIDGARKWAESGLAIPRVVTEASNEYMAEQNDLKLWLDECCEQSPNLRQGVNHLYQSFSVWKQSNGEHAPSVKSFSQRLERIHKKTRTRSGVSFEGIKVRLFEDFLDEGDAAVCSL